MDRRDFIKAGAVLGGASLLGTRALPAFGARPAPVTLADSILNGSPANSGIDTVVVVMMENRSFDSYLGWLARDADYRQAGRSRYGSGFFVGGDSTRTYPAPDGTLVDTYRRVQYPEADPWRACNFQDPGHGWDQGRAQRDGGFLAEGSRNDIFALGYFEAPDLPMQAALARRFTTCDQWYASCLGPTYPNREYLLSGQSGGHKSNDFEPGGFQWPTIVDRLAAKNVPVADYYSDLPPLALWGTRMADFVRPISQYYDDAANGKLPNVCFIDPAFIGGNRTDDHPHGDPRAAQQFIRDVFAAFARSEHWNRGLFILTYDEWGGFFDHKRPPLFMDNRRSTVDQNNFAQAGFRVPTVLCSPRALPGAVDHTRYDHTAVLRFLEWRFLNAPPRGPHQEQRGWFLTKRDRWSENPGESLSRSHFDPDPGFDLDLPIAMPSPPCGAGARSAAPTEDSGFEATYNAGYFDSIGVKTFVT